jgi:hypothetical protein
MHTRTNRRLFLRNASLGSSGLLILRDSRLAFPATANDKLNVAGIGVSDQGRGNVDNVAGLGQNMVALCDVDHASAADTFKKYPQAKVFKDHPRSAE